jgi:deoxyribonuclease V
MIVAFDTYYYNGYSYTVGGVFKSWGDKEVSYFVTSKRDCIDAEYKPGELYKRELPCIMQCLSMLNIDDIELIIVDGFVWLSEDGKTTTKALGARLQDAILNKYQTKKTIVGVAKNKYHVDIPDCVEIERGLESKKPLFITCSEPCFTEHYAAHIKGMHGDYRIPSILKAVDSKTRSFGEEDCEEVDKQLEEEYNSKPIDIDFGTFEEFIATCDKNGFKYK